MRGGVLRPLPLLLPLPCCLRMSLLMPLMRKSELPICGRRLTLVAFWTACRIKRLLQSQAFRVLARRSMTLAVL
nr:MAG TPA: hypothetical protein [Caudoviricetes sp.]